MRRQARSACVWSAAAHLGKRQAYVLREAFHGGASYAELAERMQVPLGTMKSWIRRSLMRLKTYLEP